MKKLLIITLALVFVIGSASMVFAGFDDSNMGNGLEASPAFEHTNTDSYDEHYTHKTNTPRFDIDNGNIRIPTGKLIKTK